MTGKVKDALKHYGWGLWAASFNGAIAAVVAGIGLSSGSAIDSAVKPPGWKEMIALFGGSFLIRGLIWLNSHPLPETLPAALDDCLPESGQSKPTLTIQ